MTRPPHAAFDPAGPVAARRSPAPPRALGVVRAGLALLLGWLCLATRAADADEQRAFEALAKMGQDGLHEIVDRDAGAFLNQFTNSQHTAEVVLLQAQARLAQRKFDDAIALLAARAAIAGALADEFAFWQAEAQLRKGDAAAAAEGFARVAAGFPDSPRRIEAAVQEAVARYRAGQPGEAAARLREANGPFQVAARAQPANPWTQRGGLLLAQLLLEIKDVPAAEQALAQLNVAALPAELDWQRRYLLGRAQFTAGRLPEALAFSTNLWSNIPASVSADVAAEAATLEGRIREGLQQVEAALAAYERNLATNAPAAQRRFALERIVELGAKAGGGAAVAARLQAFIERNPQDPLLDVARVALGEAYLRDFYALNAAATPANLPARTNLLNLARAQFDSVLANHPQSPLAGRAELNRGWTLWEEGAPRLADSLASFRAATGRLAPSVEQATARLKWADAQARTADARGALTNYWLVATNYPDVALPNALRTEALFQIVRAGIEAGELATATDAAAHLARLDAGGETAQRAELLIAQTLGSAGQPEAARARYEAFLQRYTNSVYVPEVRLLIARTQEQRGDNAGALAGYAAWLATYTNTTSLRPGLLAQAAFDHARVSHRLSPDPTSLGLLTNFIARFPDSTNAPLAQYLVGEHYFNVGEYAGAELAFQDKRLAPDAARPGEELPYRARLMAGRAAVARSAWQNAREHFGFVITNGPLHVAASTVPIPVVAEAYILRGDTFLLEPGGGGTNALQRFADAIDAFAKVAERFPTNDLAPRAWGRIGDCNLQLATQDPKRYDAAADAYAKASQSGADASVRSTAEVGLGIVREKQARLKPALEQPAFLEEALAHYLNVFYGRNLRAGEPADPYWVKRAGLAAIQLAETMNKPDVVLGLYERLVVELPALRERYEKRLAELRAAARPAAP